MALILRAVTDHLEGSGQRTAHWERIYQGSKTNVVSWYQSEPEVSLELIALLGLPPGTVAIDVGGGESFLVDRLLARGFTDLTVLDISAAALHASRQRVGDDAPVNWLAEDLLEWEPTRTYDLWHDRAVFHFLADREVEKYLDLLRRALSPSGAIILATFASDGPDHCSGLPVTRYSPLELEAMLGAGFETVRLQRDVHTTPGGMQQPFTWIAVRRVLR
ncbi:MAG TPA: class I SAM-dependent methyltransferase [Acidimicrobiales bacterium]|nr:class I SAM-dependent methyltransferase [Acidimicrobiales bacterium]